MVADMNARINARYWKLMQHPFFCRPTVINGLARVMAAACPKSRPAPGGERASELARQIARDGHTEYLSLTTPDQIREMRAYFDDQLCHDPWRPHLGQFKPHEIPSAETNMGWYTEAQIINAPHVLDILTHPLVLGTVERALGCKPTLGFLNMWWAYPERQGAKGSQRFHRDFDGVRFIKLFLYLTDVDGDSGPHVYVPGTHDRAELYHPRAMTDDEVAGVFGAERMLRLTGPAGTAFLADTRGIHKGLLPKVGERLALIAQYTVMRSAHQPAHTTRRVEGDGHHHDRYVMRRYLDFA